MWVRIQGWLVCLLSVLLLGMFLGCSSSTSTKYKDGRLFVVNDLVAMFSVWVLYDGVRYDIPFNKTQDGEATGVGAVQIGDGLIPGGMSVRFEYAMDNGNQTFTGDVSLIIDGDMTVELYTMDLNDPWHSATGVRIIPGKWDGAR